MPMFPIPLPLLIVEDNPMYAELVPCLLPTLGTAYAFETKWVDSPEKAVSELAHKRYDLMLLDGARDRKRAGDAWAEERALLRDLMNSIPDSIYFKDRESRYIRANQALTWLLGADSPDDLIGKTDADCFLSKFAAARRAAETDILRSGQPVVARPEQVCTCEGQELWLAVTKVPLRDRRGDIVGLGAISRDSSDHKQLQNGLVRTAEELRVRNAQMPSDIDLAREIQEAFLPAVNRALFAALRNTRVPVFASAFYLVADAGCSQVRFSNAAHPCALCLLHTNGQVVPLDFGDTAPGPALGLFEEANFPADCAPLACGDRLLLFADGIFEVAGAQGRFELGGLTQWVQRRATEPTQALIDGWLADVQAFTGTTEFSDPICLVAIEASLEINP